MSVSQSFIAKQVGVSRTAVSHVLNGRTHMVSPKVLERILEAVKAAGYHRNALVRAMKTNRTHVLGVIVPYGDISFFSEIMRGVESEARAHGYQCFFCQSLSDSDVFEKHVSALQEYRVDGLIIAPTNTTTKPDIYQAMQAQRFPFILVDNPVQGIEASIVESRDTAIGRIGAEHLLELGHRHIACVHGYHGSWAAKQRLNGFLQTLRKAGIQEDPELIIGDGFGFESGVEATRKLMDGKMDFTAIVTHSDMAALGVIQELGRHGLRVPDDVSVVGCANLNISGMVTPPLTTVDQKPGKMGSLAVRTLIEQIEGAGTEICKILIEPKLVVRESTAKCKRRSAR